MKKDQRGFSAVGVVLVLVIIALIGVVGWFVYDKNKTKNPATSSASTQTATNKTATSQSSQKAVDPTAKWLKYTSQNNKYSISIPDGWQLLSLKGSDDFYASDGKDIKLTDGTAANVEIIEGGRDFSAIPLFLVYNYTADQKSYLSPDLKKVKTYTTPNQVEVEKFTRTQTSEPEGMGIPKGTIEYTYDLTAKGLTIHITHDIQPGETDQTQLIEEMIGTLKFLF